MQATPDKDFDKLFQERFGTFEVEPSSAVWRGIASELNSNRQKKPFPVFRVLAAAASVLVVLSLGLWLSAPEEKIRLQGKADNLVVKEELPDNTVSKPVQKETRTKIRSAEKTLPEKTSGLAAAGPINPAPAEQKVTEREAPRIEEAPVKQTELAKTNTPAPKDVKTSSTMDRPVLAFVEDQTSAPDTKKDVEQHRVKNVADLVNFVVGKVDPRTDKIIQFSSDEEGGSEVSGINLGLLKFKSKKNR